MTGDPNVLFPRPAGGRGDWGQRNKQPRRSIAPKGGGKPPPKKSCPLDLIALPVLIPYILIRRIVARD